MSRASTANGTASGSNEPPRKPGYYLRSRDWPTDVPRDDLTVGEIYEALDSFDEVYNEAMVGLSRAGTSTTVEPDR